MEEAVLEEAAGQSLVHLPSRPLETVYWRDFEFLHVLAAVLIVAFSFSPLIALQRAEEGSHGR